MLVALESVGCTETRVVTTDPAQTDAGTDPADASGPDQPGDAKQAPDSAAEPAAVWASLELQTTVGQVLGIWGSSVSDVWFVANRGAGGGSALLHYDGREVSGNNISGSLRAIWGTAQNDVWVLGDQGAYATFDGKAWAGQSTFTNGDVYGTWGTSTVWAVGRYVGVNNLRRTNTNHSDWEYGDKYDLPRTATGKLYSVSGWGGQAFVAGEPGLWVWNGAWTPLTTNETKHVYGIPGGAVSTDGFRVWFTNGTDVIETDAQPPDVSVSTSRLNAVWGTSEEDVWVAGTKGYLAHFDGVRWTRAPSVTEEDLLCIWGKTSGDVWAAGDDVLLHYGKR